MRRVPALVAVSPTILLLACLVGCEPERKKVDVTQPIQFAHAAHLTYLRSGKHAEEMIRMHLVILEEEEAPEEIVRGECSTCHDVAAEKPRCAGCHVPMQNEGLRARPDVLHCIGCHRGVWSAEEASIPAAIVCRSCHGAEALTRQPEEARLREYLDAGRDIPWVRLHTFPDHVHFSHVAHVRFANMECTRCHEDPSSLAVPTTTVTAFSMSSCMECHERQAASLDCLACHQ